MNLENAITYIIELLRTTGVQILVYALVFIFVSIWLICILWVWQDIRGRVRNIWIQLLVIVWVSLTHVIGLVTYILFRPGMTLQEKKFAWLEERYLQRLDSQLLVCPRCQHPISEDYTCCPACGYKVRNSCSKCGRPVAEFWEFCPYCEAEIDRKKEAVAPNKSAVFSSGVPVGEEINVVGNQKKLKKVKRENVDKVLKILLYPVDAISELGVAIIDMFDSVLGVQSPEGSKK